MRRRLRDLILAAGSATLVTLIVLRDLIWRPGYLIYRDLFPGQLYYPHLWHPQGSFLALENYKFVTYTGIFLPLRSLGLDVYEKAIYLSAFVVAYLAFYWFAFWLIDWLGSELTRGERHGASIIAALVYVANPAAANIYFDFSLFVGYAFAPLILGLLMELLMARRRLIPGILLTGSLWWLAAIKAHWIVFGALLLAPPTVVMMIRAWRRGKRGMALVRPLYTAVGIILVYLVLSAYWLVPFLSAREGRFVGSYAPMTYEAIDALSTIPFSQALRLLGSYPAWPYVSFEPPFRWTAWLWGLVSWLVPCTALAGLYLHRRRWQVWVLAVFVVAGVVLTKGVAPPFGALYDFLVFGPLTPSGYRWLFRVSSKWAVFSSLGYSGLVATALGIALREGRGRFALRGLNLPVRRAPLPARQGHLLLGGFLLAFAFYAWPSFTGDFDGALEPVPLPSALEGANRWLAAQPGDGKAHWMPVTNGREISWNRRPSGDLYTSLASRPSIATNWNRHPVLYYSYAYEALANGRTDDFGKLMAILNTGYVVYHDDVVTTHIHEDVEPVSVLIEEGEAKIADQLHAQSDMVLAWQDDFVSIFAAQGAPGNLFVPRQVFLTTQDLSVLTSLATIDGFDPTQSALLFDTARSQGRFELPVDGLILGHDAADYLALSRLRAESILAPAEATLHGDIIDAWSRLDVYQFDWQSALHLYGLDTWDFDYGKGIAVHTDEVRAQTAQATQEAGPAASPQHLEVLFTVTEAGPHHIWIRHLTHARAADLHLSVDGTFLTTVGGSASQTGFAWEDAGAVTLPAGDHILGLRGRDGLSAVNAVAVLGQAEMASLRREAQALARRTPQLYLLEAESDFDCSQAAAAPDDLAFSAGKAAAVAAETSISTTLELAAAGAYQVAVRAGTEGGTSLWARLGETTVRLQPPASGAPLGWWVSEPLPLPAAPVDVAIGADGAAVVDAVALCSRVTACPEGFFHGTAPAEVRYRAVDPTRFRVEVTARRPFVLALAETYDPLWAATSPQGVAASLPLYGVINGFYLERPGSYALVVEYQIAQGARVGRLLTALVGLLLVIAYLVLWRAEPGVGHTAADA